MSLLPASAEYSARSGQVILLNSKSESVTPQLKPSNGSYLIWNKVQSHYHSLQGSRRSEPHLSLRSQLLLLINSFVSMITKMLPRYHTTSPSSIHFPSLIDIKACFLFSPQSSKSPLPFPFPALDCSPWFTEEQ